MRLPPYPSAQTPRTKTATGTGGERGERWVELAVVGVGGLLSAGGGPAKSPVPVEGDVPFRYATVVD